MDERVTWSEYQTPRTMYPRYAIPTDPLFLMQWHLANIKAKEGAWDVGITGKGITLGIVDDGLQHTHPDLQGSRYQPQWSHDYNDGDADPSPGI